MLNLHLTDFAYDEWYQLAVKKEVCVRSVR